MGVGRVYCGRIREDSVIYIYSGNRYESKKPIKIQGFKLFHFMGRHLNYMKSIPAGNVCGIGGLGDYISKSGFACTIPFTPHTKHLQAISYPVVRVAVTPIKYSDMTVLKNGLKLLSKSDTAAQVRLQENGEYVICASGELHLERCIRDLKDTYAKGMFLNCIAHSVCMCLCMCVCVCVCFVCKQ